MRTVLVTGPGGAGRTTVAAATALAAADRGSRTLLLSAEAIPGFPAGTGPTPVTDRLDHVRIDSGEHFRAELTELQNRASGVLDLLGAGRLDGEELTELPGSPQLALLHTLRRAAEGDLSGYETLVVDLPPLTEALALLALPEQLRRYLRRLLPAERQAARALRPVLAQLAGVPMPAQWLYEAAARKDEELAAVQALIEDGATTLRLVAEPGPAAEDALRTARTGLSLHGLTADLLVASRVLPRHSSDPWFAALAAQQEKCLDHWHQDVAPDLPVHEAAHLGRDPEGVDDLAALEIPAPGDRTPGRAGDPWWTEEEQDAEEAATFTWCLPLPGAAKEDLRLVRRGDELLLTVGPFHRIVRIASALRRCTVSGAALADGVLRVRFTPDPALWPRTS
ncbi:MULTISPECIES: ArsA-related P-loop ATPase [Streptomyces]|uniref:ArsA family ATPase n=1 Tax=Streptomyces TaxID=1883 RepID=UPI0028B18F60|nr:MULTISPECIES: ArsA-related P-loop ATPase [Streptomyces]MDX2916523.1 ArsA-related P-loop ATPase [Streptomyces sp. NE06-03C]MDX3606159.1 ArsA-related P-loop ATPase [Streptomyces sp. FL06-04B]MDX3739241.1 ArsA-related P-loop ATPase [Streptomyces sp. ID01-15D]